MKSKLIESGEYRIHGHLDAFTQLHVARKVAVSVAMLDKIFSTDDPQGMFALFAFASMRDEDVDYITGKCLSIVLKRDVSGKYIPVLNSSGTLQYANMKMNDVLELTLAVIEQDLLDFFDTALAPSPAILETQPGESQGQNPSA